MTKSVAPRAPTAAARFPLVVFFVLAFAVSWVGTIPMLWASYAGPDAVPSPLKLLQLLMLVGPGAVALWVAHREGGWPALRGLLAQLLRWRVSPWWYVAVLLGPAALYVTALLAAQAVGVSRATLPSIDRALPAAASSFALYLVLNTEELAWRGYALPRMIAQIGLVRASLLLGVIWACFHLPLFLVKGGHPAGYPPLLFGVLLVAFSVLFALAYRGSGGSVLIAHLLHQAMNAWGDALPVYPRATGSVLPIAFVAIGSALVAAVGLWRSTRRHI